MKNAIKAALAAAVLAGLNASAEPAPISHDPLTTQILRHQLIGPGLTGAVRIGSGQAITLNLADPLAAASTETLKDAVADAGALAPLKPAAGLAAKPAKAKAKRRVRTDREKLGELSDAGRRADWAGRK